MKPIFVSCMFSRASFADERLFEVEKFSGDDYCGIAPIFYCFSSSGEVLTQEDPASDKPNPGKLV